MALDDEPDFSGGESLGGGGADRALNDVGLSIGLSMLVLLVVVVSSMTALRDIAVNLPEAEPAPADEAAARPPPTVEVSLEANADGSLRAVRADGAPLDLAAPLAPRLEAQYGAELAGADAVALRVRADGALSHAAVSEAVFALAAALRSLGGGGRKVSVRYVAREAD